jgi:hypothetical protein
VSFHSVITRSLRSRSISSFRSGCPLYLFFGFGGFAAETKEKDVASIPHAKYRLSNQKIRKIRKFPKKL